MSKCKYYLEKEVVSYDGGITWNETGVTRKGNLYEEGSEDCIDPSVQYRWINMDVTTDYICDGTNKYYKQKKQVSYDGIIWQDVTPAEYQRGSIYEVNSPDCQPTYRWTDMDISTDWICEYVPEKFQATYSGGQTYEKECDENTTLTTGDTKPEGYEYSAMTSAIIGECVTSIGSYAFDSCKSLTSIAIPNSVASIGSYAFAYCSGLTSVTIPNSVTIINNGVFRSCLSLTSITIPSSVTSIGGSAFRECSGLTSITIPNNVTSIGGQAFRDCSSLTEITIPNSVTSIGNYTFRYCTGLASIRVEATTPPTLGGNAFQSTNNCPIYVQANSVEAYKSASGWSSYADRIQAIP